jgi:hypothetical protein
MDLAKFLPNSIGISRIGHIPEMRREMEQRGERMVLIAKGYATVRTGADRDSIRYDIELGPTGWEAVVKRGTREIFYSGFNEFGTVHQQPDAALRRAAEQTGDYTDERR